jgi:EmrB/QacA subfamily drug resistance transporter
VPQVSPRHRLLILAICCLSLFIVGLDGTIVNVALPTIARGLGASVSGLQWIVDGYTMVLASLVMSAGATADRFGRRQVFRAGLTVFTTSSALCSMAPSLGWLITFRVVQAVGASMLNPVAVSIISSIFKDPAERVWAIGIWISMFGVSMALGPVLGGILTGTAGWRAIFWVNVPVGLAAIALASRFIPESRTTVRHRLDVVAQVLVIVMLGSLIYAIIEGAPSDWRETGIRALFGLAGAALIALVRWELRREDPLIDPRCFRSLPFTGAVLTGICAFGCLGGFLFLSTIYLQDARGMPALAAGLHLLPAATAMAVCPLLAARLAARRGLWVPLTVGGAALTLSMAAMSRLTASSGDVYLVAVFAVVGTGLGMVDGQISTAAISAMPASQAGLASGIASASRQMGQALGVAICGALLNAHLHGPVAARFVPASRLAWFLLTGCGAVVLVLAQTAMRSPSSRRLTDPARRAPAAGVPGPARHTALSQPHHGAPPQAVPVAGLPPEQVTGPPPDPGADPRPERAADPAPGAAWAPRHPVATRPPGRPAPAGANRIVVTREDQVYYRRQWRSDITGHDEEELAGLLPGG